VEDIGIYSVIGAIFVLWVLFPIAFPVSGIWKRDGDEEYIEVEQFGPIVTGKRSVDGGNHLYSGFQIFIFLWLKRRDFGIPALIAQGFPENIAKKINGSVTARLRARRASRQILLGAFRPQRILFDEASNRVMSRSYEAATPRRFVLTNLHELPSTKVEVKRTGLPPPDAAKKKKHKQTF
jgi:hypothetical protein